VAGGSALPFVIAWLHLSVLWSFAVAKPLFDVLADSPEFFVARGNTNLDVVLLAFGLVLIPPTLLLLVELALSPWPRVRELAHLTFVAGLTIALLMQIFKSEVTGPGIALTFVALAAGPAAALLYARTPAARSVLTVLAPMPVVFLVVFLGFSPVNDLFASDDVPVRSDVKASAPVVVVVFDEFSVETLMTADREIDAKRFPNFAKLARSATWYRNATTISDHTTDAVPAVLTGRYPAKDALPTAASHPHSLFTLLGGAYSLNNVTEPATNLCPSRRCGVQLRAKELSRLKSLGKDLSIVALRQVFPQRLAAKLPEVNQGFGNFGGQGHDQPNGGAGSAIPDLAFQDRASQFNQFLGRMDATHPHRLNFIHVLLPHTSYQYLPDGQSYPPIPGKDIPGVDENGFWTKEPALPQQSFQRNLLQVGFVDRLVGRLIQRLRSQGLYDKALIVLTADHGISFRPGSSRRTATGPGAADVLGVPLFVKLPGQRKGAIDDRHATNGDVLPTIADVLGIDLRWHTDGRSLRGAPRPDSDPVVVSIFPSRDRVSLPFDAYVQARDSEVGAQHFREGPGKGWAGVYALGAYSGLFGRPVSKLSVGPASGLHAQIEQAGSFASVNPTGATVPAFVSGTLSGGTGGLQSLALVVNGVVQGVAPPYSSGGETHFGGLVPPSAFRPGKNDVRVYAITGSGDSPRLSPVAG
jgi:hypothetical protein